ncbi:YciI family protein [Microbacterium sp. 22296]|uniref:YciI family protein n=1 Tax=Microbacterium sp. 22296 TaxID=3453903 RepID=UPI003F8365DF
MKFMLIMRGTDEAYAAYKEIPFEQVINDMGAYNESMMTAGVLVAGDGLAEDMSKNFVVEFGGEEPVVTDGPYGETHELFNGFWIIEVSSRDEAVEWARRAPLIAGNKLEVRRVTDETDFAAFADNEYIQKEEGWREEQSTR